MLEEEKMQGLSSNNYTCIPSPNQYTRRQSTARNPPHRLSHNENHILLRSNGRLFKKEGWHFFKRKQRKWTKGCGGPVGYLTTPVHWGVQLLLWWSVERVILMRMTCQVLLFQPATAKKLQLVLSTKHWKRWNLEMSQERTRGDTRAHPMLHVQRRLTLQNILTPLKRLLSRNC